MPVSSKLSLAELTDCMRMIPMRRSRGEAKGHQHSVTLDLSGGSQAAQFASSMMQQMKQMQDLQQYPLQMFAGRQPSNSSAAASTACLPLEDRSSPKLVQRLNGRLALLDVPAASEPPAAQTHNDVIKVEGQHPETLKREAEEAAPEEQPQRKKPSVTEAIETVQQALQARKAAKEVQTPKNEKSKPKTSKTAGKEIPPNQQQQKQQHKKKQQKSSPPVKKAELKAKPIWAWEATRGQIMCRTGLAGPGQRDAINYKDDKEKKKAVKAADEWVAQQRKKFGIK